MYYFYEARLNNIQELTPYLKENTELQHYKDQLVNVVKEIIAVYIGNHTRPTDTNHNVTHC
jgi:hypothetical protein